MTPERAKFIIDNPKMGGDFAYAFRQKFNVSTFRPDPKGITEDEDKFIRDVWSTLPGDRCYHDAVVRIARGDYVNWRPEPFRCYVCGELLPPRARALSDDKACIPCVEARITGRPMKSEDIARI